MTIRMVEIDDNDLLAAQRNLREESVRETIAIALNLLASQSPRMIKVCRAAQVPRGSLT